MITMRRDAMMKVRAGVTTPGEVMRNVYTLG
jgi:type II secretory ATPase GspE/PulE/Tfp pilus assembly ATPase PilB-like protein